MAIRRTEWVLTHASLSKLLALFDPDPERAAEQYECVRVHLIKMFEARGCFASHELADEVTDRVIRRIEAGEEIVEATFKNYFFGVARNVFREYLRSPESMLSSRELFDLPDASLKETAFLLGGSDEREREMNCLEACLGKLPPETQRLIISYYDWEDGKKIPSRKRLAAELGLSLNSLRIRAHRIREELEKCATGCIEASTSSLK